MKLQIIWQDHVECRSRNDGSNAVLHIHAVQRKSGSFRIGNRPGKRERRAERVTQRHVSTRVDAFGGGTDSHSDVGRSRPSNRVRQILINQVFDSRGSGRRNVLNCRPTLCRILNAKASGSGKSKHLEAEVGNVNEVEGNPQQQGDRQCRFQQARPVLSPGAVPGAQFSYLHRSSFLPASARLNSNVSPTQVWVQSSAPGLSSSTAAAFQNKRVMRNGRIRCATAMTFHALSRTTISIGNLMPHVCTPCEGTINNPSPDTSSGSPSKPTMRVNSVSATRMFSPDRKSVV